MEAPRENPAATCSVKGCDEVASHGTLCGKHSFAARQAKRAAKQSALHPIGAARLTNRKRGR